MSANSTDNRNMQTDRQTDRDRQIAWQAFVLLDGEIQSRLSAQSNDLFTR